MDSVYKRVQFPQFFPLVTKINVNQENKTWDQN